MAHEKQYTPKQAAFAVLEKVGELLKKSELIKAEGFKHADTHAGHDIHVGREGGKWGHQLLRHGSGLVHGSNSGAIYDSSEKAVQGAKAKLNAGLKKAETENLKKSAFKGMGSIDKPKEKNSKAIRMTSIMGTSVGAGLGKSEQPGKIHPKEKEQAPSDNVREQVDPQHNPKEQAEGNNELAGTTPTQVGQDGKNLPGFDEMRGHIKLAKFLGRMEHKRISKASLPIIKSESDLEKSAGWKRGNLPAKPTPMSGAVGVHAQAGASKEKHKVVIGQNRMTPNPKLPG